MLVHTFYSSSKPAWSTSRVQGQPELYSKSSLKRRKKKKQTIQDLFINLTVVMLIRLHACQLHPFVCIFVATLVL